MTTCILLRFRAKRKDIGLAVQTRRTFHRGRILCKTRCLQTFRSIRRTFRSVSSALRGNSTAPRWSRQRIPSRAWTNRLPATTAKCQKCARRNYRPAEELTSLVFHRLGPVGVRLLAVEQNFRAKSGATLSDGGTTPRPGSISAGHSAPREFEATASSPLH